MSELDQILEWADLRTQLKQQREILEVKFKDACVHAADGGIFNITPEFLAGIKVRTEFIEGDLWVLDRNQTPVLITDVEKFIMDAVNIYHLAVSSYGREFAELRKQRSVKAMIEL